MRQPFRARRPLAILIIAALLTGLTLSFPGSSVFAAGPMVIDEVRAAGGGRSGSTVGGTAIEIHGENLSNVVEVLINGRPALSVKVINDTLVTAVTPPGGLADVGSATVTVVDVNSQTASLPSAHPLTFEYVASEPKITQPLAPNKGGLRGGEQVVITGEDFHPDAAVYFGNLRAWPVTWNHAGELIATAPARATLGPVEVKVSNPDGGTVTVPNAYTYVIVPRITALTPNWDRPGGGALVTITGSNFPSTTQVTFADVAATVVQVDSSGEWMQVIAPPGQGGACVTVSVMGPDGVPGILEGAFCYPLSFDPPEVWSVTPAQGGLNGGDRVVIEGKGFVTGARVFFGQGPTRQEAIVRNVLPDRIEVDTPPHPAGDVRVTVQNPDIEGMAGEIGYLDNAFRYAIAEDMMLLTSVTPDEGSVAGGTRVRIHGVNLKPLATHEIQVTFGGIPAGPVTEIYVDDTLIAYEVVTPAGGSIGEEFVPPQAVDVAVLVVPRDPSNPDLRSERAVLRDGFRYVLPPSDPQLERVEQADKLGYNRGPAASSFLVRLHGTDFRAPAKVWFNDVEATDVFVHEGGEMITARAPAMGQPTVAYVRVQNPDGAETTLYAAFFFDGNSMHLYSVAPTEGSTLGGTEVTLHWRQPRP